MFRIKTDIRQFKCEDKTQVEDLIRNWVIRPSDLIYQTDDKRWDPIGEHPSFQTIFEQLAQDALNDPELTPVSEVYDESIDYSLDEISIPRRIAAKASAIEDRDTPEETPDDVSDTSSEESDVPSDLPAPIVAKVSDEAQSTDDSEDEAADESAETSSDEDGETLEEPSDLPAAKPKLSLKSFQILKKAPKKEESAKEEDDEDEEPSDLPAPLPVPKAPEGVEPSPARDEVTVMTERTAELRGIDDEEEDLTTTQEFSAFRRPEAPEGVEPVVPSEETTNVFVRDEDDSQEIEKAVSTPASSKGASGVEVNFTRDEDDEDEPRLRRGDLPEELFLTNEISSPFERSALLDELAEDDGDLDADSVWDELAADDLRSTDEFDNPKVIVDDEYSGKGSDEEVTQMTAMADVLEADRDRQPESSISALESPTEQAPESESSDATEDAEETSKDTSEVSESADSAASEASQPAEISEASDPFTQFEVDPVEISPDAVEPVEYEEGESIYENELDPPEADEVFINRGYMMALPFPIGATEEDVPFGVVPSSMTDAEKNKAFPYPKPKAHMELVTQKFGHFDMSKYAIAAFVIIVVLIIITAVAFSQ